MSFIGTAGWSIPSPYKTEFDGDGSHLERYAARLNCAEINSSFYRPHKRATYEKWASAVPEDFRFSVKVPRTITRDHGLKDYGDDLGRFLSEVTGLREKLGIILVQLPPSLKFDEGIASKFYRDITRAAVTVACEPRHASWFEDDADKLLESFRVARVAADPPRARADGVPGGNVQTAYYRLHGSPRTYYSNYDEQALARLATQLRAEDWCIFDNTAGYHALGNALSLKTKCR